MAGLLDALKLMFSYSDVSLSDMSGCFFTLGVRDKMFISIATLIFLFYLPPAVSLRGV